MLIRLHGSIVPIGQKQIFLWWGSCYNWGHYKETALYLKFLRATYRIRYISYVHSISDISVSNYQLWTLDYNNIYFCRTLNCHTNLCSDYSKCKIIGKMEDTQVSKFKLTDKQIWANRVDPDQSGGAAWSGSTLFAILSTSFTCITNITKANCSKFRIIAVIFFSVQIFRIFMVKTNCVCQMCKPGKGHAHFIFKSFPQLNISFPRHNYLEGTTY